MPTLLSGRAPTALLALLATAAVAPAVQAQQHPRFQVEASLDHTGSTSMSSVIAEGPTGGFELDQVEAVRYSLGASALARVAPRTSIRFGLSLANRGFMERTRVSTIEGPETDERQVDFLYLGVPLTLGYNLVNPRPGLKPFLEAGIIPELLVREDESEFEYDLRDTGLSYLVNFGVKYNLDDGRAIILAPEARIAAGNYSRHRTGALDYRPVTVGLKLGVQF